MGASRGCECVMGRSHLMSIGKEEKDLLALDVVRYLIIRANLTKGFIRADIQWWGIKSDSRRALDWMVETESCCGLLLSGTELSTPADIFLIFLTLCKNTYIFY